MPVDERDAWEWLRNPLPPGDEEPTFASLRLQLGIPDNVFFTDKGFGSLGFFEQQTLLQTLAPGYYREHNPIVRHTVLRRRRTLEDGRACWTRSPSTSILIPSNPPTPTLAWALRDWVCSPTTPSTWRIRRRKTLLRPCSSAPELRGS